MTIESLHPNRRSQTASNRSQSGFCFTYRSQAVLAFGALALVLLLLLLGVLTSAPASARTAHRSHQAVRAGTIHARCTPAHARKSSGVPGESRRCVTARRRPNANGSWRAGAPSSGGVAFGPPLVQAPPSVSPTATAPVGATGGQPGQPSKPAAPRARGALPAESGEVVNDPIDSRFLTDVPFGTSSFWIQPWRTYLDTWPASRLLDAVGINFNVNPQDAEATAHLLHDDSFKLARLAIDWPALSYEDPSVFIPSHLANITARLTALHNNGLRPLIVLDAYSGDPTPEKPVTLETTAAAPAGATSVQLSPASAALVVPSKTGFNGLSFGGAADILITSISAGDVATLSRPLLAPLEAGRHAGTTLRYAPFGPPKLAGGGPNPQFQETLAGWLNYVGAVSKLAASIVGPGGFDLEVWNELTFSSQFLNSEYYYGPGAVTSAAATRVRGARALANGPQNSARPDMQGGVGTPGSPPEDQESDYRSDENADGEPESGTGAATGAQAGEGSEGEAPEAGPSAAEGEEGSGEQEEASSAGARPPASTAMARASVSVSPASATPPTNPVQHRSEVDDEIRKALLNATVAYVRNPVNGIAPGVGVTDGFASETPFPSGAAAPLGLTALSKHPYVSAIAFPSEYHEHHSYPINALGERDTTSRTSFTPLFIPSYQSLFPEYTLTATSPETLIRDLAPFTTYVYGFPHGREVGPPGGSPVQKWVTEYNLGIGQKAHVVGPDEVTLQTGPSATLTAADKAHFHTKVLLRSLVAMVNKGMSREYLFGAAPGGLSLIGEEFFSALAAHPETYPGDALGGEILRGFSNVLAHFQGPGPSGAPRQLELLSIAQNGNHAQFAGDGTAAHPALYDRDVLAVFPFQSSPTRFVIPVYVMTRDLLTLYEPNAPGNDLARFDLPDETFRITLGDLPETAAVPAVSAYDPVRDESTPARILSRSGSTAVFEMAATDYPRLLTIDYSGS